MTSANPLSVDAQWALYGKRLDRQGYRVLSCSSGELGPQNFEEVIGRFSPGAPSELPQVTLSYLTPGTQPGQSLLGMALHRSGEGEQQLKYDDDGRRVVVTSYFCVPYPPLKSAAVSYRALYRGALARLPLPDQSGPPIRIEVAGRAAVTPAADDLAMRAAALLLTCRPVCVLGAEDTDADQRLAFIDTVMSLLPYGLRARMTAATWTRPTNRDHKFRLFFSDAARSTEADRVLYWGRPEASAALTAGDDYAYEYLHWLEEKVGHPTAELAQLTDPIGFGGDRVLRTLETIGANGQRPTASYPAAGRGLARSEPVPRVETVTGRGFGEQLLRRCAAHLLDDDQRHLVKSDIDKLTQMARSAINDDQRAHYRQVVKETGLLKHAGLLGAEAGSLYAPLLRVAFWAPFGYDDYCQLEECLDRQPASLPLLETIHEVGGMTDPLVKAIVYGRLQQLDVRYPNKWRISLAKELEEVLKLFRVLAAEWPRPDHARIVCDFTLRSVSQMRPNPEPIREALRRFGFLAHALRANGVGSEQYQVNALSQFLRAAYPSGPGRPAIVEILTGSNRRPPTPALVAAVLLLAEPADVGLAGEMYARGSIMSADFAAETQITLAGKVPAATSAAARR